MISSAVAALGTAPLAEAAIAHHVAPLFSRVLARNATEIYLANHSLGRPLDAIAGDVAEALVAWQRDLGDAWDAWLAEMDAYRERLAQLLKVTRRDCIVPKNSAGRGLRAILNTYDARPRVVATRSEFDSIDIILRQYARRGRIALRLVESRTQGELAAGDIAAAIEDGVDLLVVSQVLFNSGQVLPELPALIRAAHDTGARVLLDVYHSLGVLPVDMIALDADFAIGGSYKYLRGGPGACYLYIHPRHLDGTLSTLDTGWFAKKNRCGYERPDPPEFAAGGDAFLESTPAVLPFYQARAGQIFTLAVGVERLRAYSLTLQRRLVGLLEEGGIDAQGGMEDRGAFVVVRTLDAARWAAELFRRGVRCDARGEFLRLCPDVLTTEAELRAAAGHVASVAAV